MKIVEQKVKSKELISVSLPGYSDDLIVPTNQF